MNIKIISKSPSKTKYGTIHRIDGLNKVTPIHVPLWEYKLKDDPELDNIINKRVLSDNIVSYLGEPLANKGDLVTRALLEYLVGSGIENIDVENEDISPELQAEIESMIDRPGSKDEESIGIIPKEDNRPMYVNKNGEVAIAPEGMSIEALKDILAKGGDPEEHFGEQQAEGLDNLLEGLRDTPHDNRW